jgi:hypothetical protein
VLQVVLLVLVLVLVPVLVPVAVAVLVLVLVLVPALLSPIPETAVVWTLTTRPAESSRRRHCPLLTVALALRGCQLTCSSASGRKVCVRVRACVRACVFHYACVFVCVRVCACCVCVPCWLSV